MDINPSALMATPASASTATKTTSSNPHPPLPRQPKLTIAPRLDLEPYYNTLRTNLSSFWPTYTTTLSSFLLGNLNQTELSDVLDPYLTTNAVVVHAHNQLLIAIIANCYRDIPDPGIAAFVSATEASPVPVKGLGAGGAGAAGDRAEARLKREVKCITAKERRRVKDVGRDAAKEREKESAPGEELGLVGDLKRAYIGKKPKLPEPPHGAAPPPPGVKVGTEHDVRKRYNSTLFAESGELSQDMDVISQRLEPITYEYGLSHGFEPGRSFLSNGSQVTVANFIKMAIDAYTKKLITSLTERSFSDLPTNVMGVRTGAYQRHLEDQEAVWAAGSEETSPSKSQAVNGVKAVNDTRHHDRESSPKRRKLDTGDLQNSLRVGTGNVMGEAREIFTQMIGGQYTQELQAKEDPVRKPELKEQKKGPTRDGDIQIDGLSAVTNKDLVRSNPLMWDPDWDSDGDPGWSGASWEDQRAVGNLLDSCLAL